MEFGIYPYSMETPANMILPIVAYGNDILKQNTIPAEPTNDQLKSLIPDMKETMFNARGAGLAAPQVNSNLSMFIAMIGVTPTTFINPTVKKRRGERNSIEGCLSIPGLNSVEPIKRTDIIDVEFYDEDFNKKSLRLRGFDAIVFQHEYDHLNGILFIDHFTQQGKEKIADTLAEIENGKVRKHYDMIFSNTSLEV